MNKRKTEIQKSSTEKKKKTDTVERTTKDKERVLKQTRRKKEKERERDKNRKWIYMEKKVFFKKRNTEKTNGMKKRKSFFRVKK